MEMAGGRVGVRGEGDDGRECGGEGWEMCGVRESEEEERGVVSERRVGWEREGEREGGRGGVRESGEGETGKR
jgi:hypothetical protein